MRKLGIVYKKPTLTHGETFCIKKLFHPIIDPWSPIYTDIKKPFDRNKFTVPRLPINMGEFPVELARQCPNVLRVPIKYRSNEIRLPQELLPLKDEIIRILQYDHWIMGDRWIDFFCHLTIDNSYVETGETHRYPGFHGDGLQGGKFPKKLCCEHSYIVTDPEPTVIAIQPFFVAHLNDCRHNVFLEFDKQAKPENFYRCISGDLYLIDPYVVHKSPEIIKPANRLFFRLTTTPAELLTDHNTVNPMFHGQNYPQRIEMREFVSVPNVDIPLDFYGIAKM